MSKRDKAKRRRRIEPQFWPLGDRRPHRWGYTDSGFEVIDRDTVRFLGERYPVSGTEMHKFMSFAREVLGADIDPRDRITEREPKPVRVPVLNEDFEDELERIFPPSQISRDDAERLRHSHGQTTSEDVYPVMYDELGRMVDLVFWCESEDDAVKLLRLAGKHDVCLVPYGGGTNVSGALVLPEDETRTIVCVDMTRMNRLLELDEENLTASFEAGIMGGDLENELGARGYTCGHEPDSIELSTLGGWIATNASGMKKNRYGNIEDIVENATLVTPKGRIEHLRPFPRASLGVRPLPSIFGTEGNLGIITRATIRIHELPEVKEYNSFLFHSMEDGASFMHELAHSGAVPASVRLVDNEQFRFGQALKGRPQGLHKLKSRFQKWLITKVLGFDPYGMVVATLVFEGTKEQVRYQKKTCSAIARSYRGFSAGPSNGRQGYMLTFAIAYIRDFMTSMHILGETFETTVPWNRIHPVTEAVRRRLEELHGEQGLPGKPFLSFRITQIYHTGVCIYFTLGLYLRDVAQPHLVLARIEHELRSTILEHGGSLSHHHGVGKIRRDFLRQELSGAAIRSLQETKSVFDPQNLFAIRNGAFGLAPVSES